MAGIYIHIPFCKQACHYCDFHFSTNLELQERLVACLMKEIQLQRQYLEGESVETVYFGGGTPSLLTVRQIKSLLKLIHDVFSISSDVEVTLEANPDDLSDNIEKLTSMKSSGINRLSIGVQSFDNHVLRYFNRAHSVQDIFTSVQNTRSAGFNNVSIDLIYGIPGSSIYSWQEEVRHALKLKPEHISAYCLTIEPKTVFGKLSEKNKLAPADESVTVSQFEFLLAELQRAGYEQYEVSNFSLRGYRSKHNTSYWLRKKYLGVGPSAHSYNGSSRQFNISNNNIYCRSIEQGTIPFEVEQLSRADNVNELLMTGLRTSWGLDLKILNEEFHYDLLAEQKNKLDFLMEKNLAFVEDGFLKLSRSGLLLADKISSDLFIE
jgi:oxygen-independent coproporphyrinogen III oxidase